MAGFIFRFSLKMVKKTCFETVARILTLRQLGLSYDLIVKKLSEVPIKISRNTVISVIKENENARNGVLKPPRKFGDQNRRSARSPLIIKKVANACSKPNPPTQAQLATRLEVSQRTIQRILAKDLELKVRKKRRTHDITPQQAAQRLERGRRFLGYLGKYKSRMIFTMDETFVTLNDFNVERDIYYQGKEVVVPASWKKKSKKSWPKKVMVAMGICWEGTSRAYIVPQKSKVNSAFFIKHVLRPMVEFDIPKLYGDRAPEVILHMDSAPAHTSAETVQWLRDHNVKFIPKEDWMANSPDMAPLDYGVNGILKKKLSSRRVTTVAGMERTIKEEWKKFDLRTVRNILSSWKQRVEVMIEHHGFHIEQVL
jgi:hypothetical protein